MSPNGVSTVSEGYVLLRVLGKSDVIPMFLFLSLYEIIVST